MTRLTTDGPTGPADAAALVRRFYDEAWNRWDDSVVDDLLAEDFDFRGTLGDEARGRDGWRAYRDMVRGAAPDFHCEVLDLVAEPGKAAARVRFTGHLTGDLLGQVGRGQRIDYLGAAFFTCPDGRLDSAWVLGDLETLRRQVEEG